MVVVFGLALLQGAPPPVHAEAPSETTLVADVVLTRCVPVQATPSVAPLQVYVNRSAALGGFEMDGPPAGAKSDVAWTVMAP